MSQSAVPASSHLDDGVYRQEWLVSCLGVESIDEWVGRELCLLTVWTTVGCHRPAPRLKDAELSEKTLAKCHRQSMHMMRRMYVKTGPRDLWSTQ